MDTVQLATRIDKTQDSIFRQTTRQLGTTPADAMRIFVAAFNQNRGFPFDVRLAPDVEPFDTEEEAADFVTRTSRRVINEAR